MSTRRRHIRVLPPVFLLLALLTLFVKLRSQGEYLRSRRTQVEYNENVLLDDINNATLGFEKIFVINLPIRTDRKDAMTLAASFSNLTLNWIDGVSGSTVPERTLPLEEYKTPPGESERGSWRAHMNALQAITENGHASALIMEDDQDWDLRLREQLQTFALGVTTLVQPLRISRGKTQTYADPSFPEPDAVNKITTITHPNLPTTIPPSISPYGDNWDILWLGHCGMAIPERATTTHSKGIVILHSDSTVPGRRDLTTDLKSDGGPNLLRIAYPEHTRLIHHAYRPVCSTAYAVSQRGARKILYELGVRKYTSQFDNQLRELCDGEKMRETRLVCLTSQPSYFSHWRARGREEKDSDIAETKGEWRDKGESVNIRWSVRQNLGRFVRGEGEWEDQYPDR
ncbi:glycosyltransferase family 25 protein [Massarina eburnea CBS 473.64]|uniref:Glycosyltransferase family 25 protein n=1 Tax=Massarina eburnea CBS 473.64 TaxID=1395130 RepID=A0A6A6S4T3_9PLEO|nr:glycosyltransferase family 25 protein [Massarina eburnea CBS 473.64]